MAKKLTALDKSKQKASILTKRSLSSEPANQLTRHSSLPFSICFKHKLNNEYNFTRLQKRDLKSFQNFLDCVSKLNFSDVDKQYLRKSDKNDTLDEFQIVHYRVSKSFRLHGYISSAMFHVIRIDPNHKKHN